MHVHTPYASTDIITQISHAYAYIDIWCGHLHLSLFQVERQRYRRNL